MKEEQEMIRDYEGFVFSQILSVIPIKDMLINKLIEDAVFLCDSLAVRANTGYCRSFETDIDFLFPENDMINDFLLTVERECKPRKIFNKICGSAGFFRLYFSAPFEIEFGNEFIIDLHVGSYFHKGQPIINTKDLAVKNVYWKDIKSFGGLEKVNLPVPNIEALFALKLLKFIGSDPVDLISVLLSGQINTIDQIRSSITSKDDILLAIKNLEELHEKLPSQIKRWSKCHFSEMSEDESEKVKESIRKLLSDER